MEQAATARALDRRGKTISTSVVFDAAAELATMADGDVLELVTDDFEPLRHDVAAWCEAAGHTLVRTEPTHEGRRSWIERGTPDAKTTSLAMVVSSAGLEELLSPLGFALAAALERTRVHLFVQGPAVRVLVRGYRPRLAGWGRPFSRFAAAGMARAGHVPAQEKLAQLRSLGAEIYLCGPSMQHFKVDPGDLVFDDLPMVEYLTFMAVMERADVQIYT